MLAGRVLQGIGLAGPRSMVSALIRDHYSGRTMARMMSSIMAVFILVPTVAPAIAGCILGAYIGYLNCAQQIFQVSYQLRNRFPLVFGILSVPCPP